LEAYFTQTGFQGYCQTLSVCEHDNTDAVLFGYLNPTHKGMF